MRNSKILFFYLFKETGSYVFNSFFFFFVIFLLNNLIVMARDFLGINIPPEQVLQLIIFNIPYVVMLAAPFACLLGVLLAVSQLSNKYEVSAMQSLGFSRQFIFMPVLLFALLFTLGSFMVNDILLPLGAIQFKKLIREIAVKNPALELGSFSVKQVPRSNISIVTGFVDEESINDLVILDRTNDNRRRLILSETASFDPQDSGDVAVSFELGELVGHIPHDKNRGEFDFFEANSMIYNILLSQFAGNIDRPTPLEMTSPDLFAKIQSMKQELAEKISDYQEDLLMIRYEIQSSLYESEDYLRSGTNRQIDLERYVAPIQEKLRLEELRIPKNRDILNHELEFYQKFSLPLGCISFAFFCFPLGIINRRSGFFITLLIGFLVSILYFGSLVWVRDMAFTHGWDPFFSIFGPNIVTTLAGVGIFVARGRQ